MLQVRGLRKVLKHRDAKEQEHQKKPGGRSKAKGKGSNGRRKRNPRNKRSSRWARGRPTAAFSPNGSSPALNHPRFIAKLEPDLDGAPECPCITNLSSLFKVLQADLNASGLPVQYGTMGCKAYDVNSTAADCTSNSHSYCFSPWCYVDPEMCPINETLCHNAGGHVGSMKSPFCRTRDVKSGQVASHQYSYATCGSLSTYDDTEEMKALAGRVIRVAVDTSEPYLVNKPSASGEQEFGGPLYDFFSSALAGFEPKPVIEIVPFWATNDSKAMFASSHTACTHDVAVGALDICVADLWRTPQRALMADFTPTLRTDSFFLVVPHEMQTVSFWSRLKTPFKPFTPKAWAAVLIFLFGMSLLRWLMKLWATGASSIHYAVHELGHFMFLMFDDFLESSSDIESDSIIHKSFRLAFAFFVLVIMASYTASLASMLVVNRQALSEITDITSAIEQNVAICAPIALKLTLTRLYPHGVFVYSDWLLHSPRQIHNGTCGAAVMSKNAIDKIHAGYAHQNDCEAVSAHGGLEEEMRCSKGFDGEPRNDCALQAVGEVIVEIPIAFPVNKQLAHSLTWAFTKHWASGVWEESVAANANLFPISQCEVTQRTSEDGLSFADLGGTIMISFFIVIAGGCCHALVHVAGFQAPVSVDDKHPDA